MIRLTTEYKLWQRPNHSIALAPFDIDFNPFDVVDKMAELKIIDPYSAKKFREINQNNLYKAAHSNFYTGLKKMREYWQALHLLTDKVPFVPVTIQFYADVEKQTASRIKTFKQHCKYQANFNSIKVRVMYTNEIMIIHRTLKYGHS